MLWDREWPWGEVTSQGILGQKSACGGSSVTSSIIFSPKHPLQPRPGVLWVLSIAGQVRADGLAGG